MRSKTFPKDSSKDKDNQGEENAVSSSDNTGDLRVLRKVEKIISKEHIRHASFLGLGPRLRDEDEGREGGTNSDLRPHPLLMNVPDGAPSDLSADAVTSSESLRILSEKEEDQLSPELKKSLQNNLGMNLGKKRVFNPKPS